MKHLFGTETLMACMTTKAKALLDKAWNALAVVILLNNNFFHNSYDFSQRTGTEDSDSKCGQFGRVLEFDKFGIQAGLVLGLSL